jgi:hypothetical protein
MRKLKLKEDADGNKVTDVKGIRAACKVMKTRYAKPFEAVQVKIPYETGMNPYSGLVDLAEKQGLLTKQGNRLKYLPKGAEEGEEILMFRKAWEKNTDGALDTLMADISTEDETVYDDADTKPTTENIETMEVENDLAQELESES